MLGSFGTSLELRRWSFKIDSWPERTEISRARRELLTGLPGSNCRATENNPKSELLHGVAGGVRQMKPFSWFGAGQDDSFRRVRRTANVSSTQIAGWRRPRSARGLAVLPAADYPTSVSLNRLAYEYGLKDELDGASASPDLELVRERGGPR
jgi:hypothetical protein